MKPRTEEEAHAEALRRIDWPEYLPGHVAKQTMGYHYALLAIRWEEFLEALIPWRRRK